MATDFDGLLLIGHGTREPAGLAEFWQLVELLRREQPDWKIEGCFLELAEPTIAAGLQNLARHGARRVRAVPLVLFAAGHAKRDIPAALAAAAQQHPNLYVEQAPHLGCHEAIIELSERRFQAAIRDQQLASTEHTLLLLVGRGSNDPEATRAMHDFAARRATYDSGTRPPSISRVPNSEFDSADFDELSRGELVAGRIPNLSPQVSVAFMAMADPPLTAALQAAARSPFARCVVQPHLLFAGLLLAELRAEVDRMAAQTPGKQWIVTDHPGPDIRLATAVADIARTEIASPSIESKNQSAAGYVLKDV